MLVAVLYLHPPPMPPLRRQLIQLSVIPPLWVMKCNRMSSVVIIPYQNFNGNLMQAPLRMATVASIPPLILLLTSCQVPSVCRQHWLLQALDLLFAHWLIFIRELTLLMPRRKSLSEVMSVLTRWIPVIYYDYGRGNVHPLLARQGLSDHKVY